MPKNNVVDFKAVAAKLCRKPLSQEQKKSIDAFNAEYDNAHKSRHNGRNNKQ